MSLFVFACRGDGDEPHLLGFVEAMLVTVREVEGGEPLPQFLLGTGDHVQCCMQLNMAGALKKRD